MGYWGSFTQHENGDRIQRWISSPMPSAMPPYCRIILPRRTMLYKLAQAHLKESTKQEDKEFDEYEGQKSIRIENILD